VPTLDHALPDAYADHEHRGGQAEHGQQPELTQRAVHVTCFSRVPP
jgi:hypothetical protein